MEGEGFPQPPPAVPQAPERMPRKDRVIIIVSVVVSLLVVVSCFLIPFLTGRGDEGQDTRAAVAELPTGRDYAEEQAWLESNRSFNTAVDAVMQNYYELPDEDYLVTSAARGISRLMQEGASDGELTERGITTMIDALDDPFSAYMDSEELKMLDSQLAGKFFGVGMSMTQARNEIRVEKVLEDTPAEAAGIQENDVIVSVDGADVGSMDLIEVVQIIRGEEGVPVRIGIKRSGTPGIIHYDLVRAEIKLPVITTELLPGNVGLITFTDWTQDSSDLIKGALEDLKAQGVEGLILDLRANPGGLMDPAIKSADLFLGGGNIVSSKGRAAGFTNSYDADPDLAWDHPVVILTSRGTASSSEIFSAALRDNERAVLVGETTFGKGEIQTLKRQPDGSALRITVALYYTPDGTSINDEGITPDVLVTNPVVGEDDLQLSEAERVITAIMQGQSWKQL